MKGAVFTQALLSFLASLLEKVKTVTGKRKSDQKFVDFSTSLWYTIRESVEVSTLKSVKREPIRGDFQ